MVFWGKYFWGENSVKSTYLAGFWDFGTHFWGIKFHGNPVFRGNDGGFGSAFGKGRKLND